MEKISIIIPIYDVFDYIGQCLESVVSQTYQNLEIICVDDCGKDESMNIVNEYLKKDKRIKVIKNITNQGVAVSRNNGLDIVTGNYVFFLDPDDYILPDIIEKLYKTIINDNSDFVLCSIGAFTEEANNIFYEKKVQKNNIIVNNNIVQIDINNLEKFLLSIPCMVWGKLFKTDFLKNNKIRFVDKNVKFEDNGFFLKIISNYPKISCIEDVGIMYRIRANSITSVCDKRQNKKNKKRDMKAVLDDAFEYIKTQNYNYDFIYSTVRNLNLYPHYFKKFSDIFYKKLWCSSNKCITVFGIPFYRQKLISSKRKSNKILGITLFFTDIV